MGASNTPLIYAEYEGSVPIHDAAHLRNHLYYLFSRTKAHPESADTSRNLILKFEGGKTIKPKRTRSFYNSNSKEACKRAQADMPTHASTIARLRSDVTYFAFMVPFGDLWISNFVHGDLSASQPEVSVDATVLHFVSGCLPSQATIQREISERLAGADHIVDYAKVNRKTRQEIDVTLIKAAREIAPVRPLVMAIHNDQAPSPCHLHRLYRP